MGRVSSAAMGGSAGGGSPPLALRLCNAAGYVVLVGVNIAAGTGALGKTNSELSAKYSTPITPAG